MRGMLPPDEAATPYIGTVCDAELVFTNPSDWRWVTPLLLIDLPLSFVFDTMMLPWSRRREPAGRVDPEVDEDQPDPAKNVRSIPDSN